MCQGQVVLVSQAWHAFPAPVLCLVLGGLSSLCREGWGVRGASVSGILISALCTFWFRGCSLRQLPQKCEGSWQARFVFGVQHSFLFSNEDLPFR
jgi:hypothetical protein